MQHTINEWLKTETVGWGVVRLFFLMFGAMLLWIIVSGNVLLAIGYQPPDDRIGIRLEYTLAFIQLIFLLAFIEELIFRVPLLLAVFLERNVLSAPIVVISAVLLSATFGYLHGGFANILTQGGLGLLFSIFFLKSGGYQFRFVKALVASTTLHASWNLFLFSIIYSTGIREI